MNEILQKVKGSQSSSSHNIADSDGIEEEQGNNNESKTSEEVKLESEITSLDTQHENNFVPIDTDFNAVNSSELHSSENKSSTEQTSELHVVPPLITLQPDSTFTPIGSTNSDHENEAVLFQYKEDSSVTFNKENHSVNGTDQIVETENLTNAETTVVRIPSCNLHCSLAGLSSFGCFQDICCVLGGLSSSDSDGNENCNESNRFRLAK